MILAALGLGVLAVLGAPLFLVIAAFGLLGFLAIGRPPADVAGEIARLTQLDGLMTIPLFTFAGYLLAESGAPRRLVAVTKALFGWMPGGMAVVTLVTCAFFTTFTGASGITIVALGGLMMPILLQQGYNREFTLGLITTSGSRGLVLPPSIPVLIYGYVASIDITRLYIAGIIPGLLDIALVAAWCIRSGVVSHVPRTPFDGKGAAIAIWKALPECLLPVLLITLIVTGILKVPEAAALTALYVLIVEVVIYRDVHPIRDLPRITKESMVLCGAIMVILGASLGLTNYLVQEGVPQALVEQISAAIKSKWVFLIALNVFLLIVGCLMDIFSAIVIVVPLLMPLAAEYGVHPIHLAIIFLINLELGYNTPPVGMNLFIASFRFRQPIVRLYRASVPFILISIVCIAILTYVEPISTFTVPADGGLVRGGLVEHKTPKGKKGAPAGVGTGTGKTAPGTGVGSGKPLADGICDEKVPGDPDCEDINVDDDDDADKKPGGKQGKSADDEGTETKRPASQPASGPVPSKTPRAKTH